MYIVAPSLTGIFLSVCLLWQLKPKSRNPGIPGFRLNSGIGKADPVGARRVCTFRFISLSDSVAGAGLRSDTGMQ